MTQTPQNSSAADAPTPPPASAWHALMEAWRPLDLAPAVYLVYVVFSLVWFRVYFTSEPIAAVDLPGHLTAIEGLRRHLFTLGYTFYDVSCFTGYPAFQFYSFLAHWATAIVSIPLSLFAEDGVRLAAHVMLVGAMVTLPLAWVWGVRPFYEEVVGEDALARRHARTWVTLGACVYAFWFINHDSQWWGIGAAAVMNIGLFSQAFAWHFMLLHLGATLRVLRDGKPGDVRLTGIFFAVLLLIHTMTAVFSFYLVFMAFLWFRERRMALVKAHVLATLLMGFWLIPMAAYLSNYTIKDIHRPQGDFLEVVLRYPFFAVGRSVWSFLHGKVEMIGFAEPLMVFLMCVLAFHRLSHKAKLLINFTVFELLGLVVLGSGFIATSIPLGFHYYRFMAYMMLFLVVLLSVVPVYFLHTALEPQRPRWLLPLATGVMGGALTLAWVTTALLPHNEREKVAGTANKTYLSNEYKVLDYFKGLPNKGRAVFEYFSDYGKYPFLSCHFMTTRLLKDTGFESINGLFVQSSLPYHFPMGAASQLKANSYNGPLLYPASTDITDEEKVVQLKEFGVTHVVSGGEEFFNKIKPFAVGEPVVIGLYKITQIQEAQPMVTPVKKHLVAYMDLRGNVPFKFMELYFFAKQGLQPAYELVEAKPGMDLPPQVEMVLINGDSNKADSVGAEAKESIQKAGGREPTVVKVDYVYYYLTRHYNTWYQHNPEIDDYAEFAKYLDARNILKDFTLPPLSAPPQLGAEFAWDASSGNQRFNLNGLQAGQVYRVNYSYFPYWHSMDAKLYRMSGDRILVWAQGSSAGVFFTRWLSFSTYVGWLMTLLGLAWIWREKRGQLAVVG